MQENSNNRSHPVKLFLVDDHLVLRQALSKALTQEHRYEVVGHAGDGQELLSQLTSCAPDVIVLEYAIPKSNCLETIEALRRVGCNAPVLILSAVENSGNIRAALKAGARGFVPKQAGLSEMQFAIDAIVDGGTYLSPSVTNRLMAADAAQQESASAVASLSQREREIMVLIANGKRNREIGSLLHISTRTVDTHRSNILKKLGIKTNAELVKISIAEGLVSV
jgi:DNA-binding NarL/FixJ family response regulator